MLPKPLRCRGLLATSTASICTSASNPRAGSVSCGSTYKLCPEKPDQTLARTKYFTSRVALPLDKAKRQSTYIDAIHTLADTSIYFGKYQTNPHACRNCGHIHNASSEKMTDVNIAVELLQDAFQDAFDSAILISADSDLIAPIEAVKKLFPNKRVIVACPPGRFSQHLCRSAHAFLKIGHGSIEKSQFPEQVRTPSGFLLRRPASWR